MNEQLDIPQKFTIEHADLKGNPTFVDIDVSQVQFFPIILGVCLFAWFFKG